MPTLERIRDREVRRLPAPRVKAAPAERAESKTEARPEARPVPATVSGVQRALQSSDGAGRARMLTTLQSSRGNAFVQRAVAGVLATRAVQRQEAPDQEKRMITGEGEEVRGETSEMEVNGCAGLKLTGATKASFEPKWKPGTIQYVDGPGGVVASGTMVNTYAVVTNVTLPQVPGGLTECESAIVTDAINTTLTAHEQQHVAAFEAYNGTSSIPFSETLAGQSTKAGAPALWSALKPLLDAKHKAEEKPRQDAAKKASAALDPFEVTVDCTPCEEKAEAAGDAGTDEATVSAGPEAAQDPPT